ncbi:MAG: PIN domain-containing protein [Sphingomonadales bacterium]
MIGLDTNVLVRLLVRDHEEQYQRVLGLLLADGERPDSFYVNHVVLVETAWVLRSDYRFGRSEIADALQSVLDVGSFDIQDRERVSAALVLFRQSKADFADCLISIGNLAAGCRYTATFDARAQAVDGMQPV